jgi:hypothetical protein
VMHDLHVLSERLDAKPESKRASLKAPLIDSAVIADLRATNEAAT